MPSGGYREGAGRPAGALNKATLEQSQRLSELAKAHTEEAHDPRGRRQKRAHRRC